MRFSVIVPFRNAENFLPEALRSLSNQDFQDFEAILVDDGSGDGSAAIAAHFSRQDSRFQVHSNRARGVSAARNSGLDVAKGDYVLFLDADDCFCPSALGEISKLVSFELPDVLVYGHTVTSGTNSSSSLNKRLSNGQRITESRSFKQGFPAKWVAKISPAVWNKAFRRDFVDAQPLRFSLNLVAGTEDLDFSYRALFWARTVQATPRQFYNYRTSVPNSLSSRAFEQSRESIAAVIGIMSTERLPLAWRSVMREQLGRFVLQSLRLRPSLGTLKVLVSSVESSLAPSATVKQQPIVILLTAVLQALLRWPKRFFVIHRFGVEAICR